MKTFATIWYIFIIVMVLFVCISESIKYCKTKNEDSISPEDLKELKKSHLIMTLLIGITLIFEHIKWLVD